MDSISRKVFDYRALRLMVGVIAFSLPFVVQLLARDGSLSSISAYYHLDASRNIFVGMLFIVGSFLLAYNGHSDVQEIFSKIAGIGAFGIALFPTSCPSGYKCVSPALPDAHYFSAVILFAILALFCFKFFSSSLENQSGKKQIRRRIYKTCGSIIVVIFIIAMALKIFLPEWSETYRVIFYAEWVALSAFGVAWFVSGKVVSLWTDDEDLYRPY